MKIYSIDEIKKRTRPIAERYGVKKVALFGSYATGTATAKSDIDLVIDKGNLKGYFAFCGFVNDLEESLKTHVDVLTYQSLKRSLINNAADNEVVLYER